MSVSSIDPASNLMFGPNKFKLGIFSANAEGGLALTRVDERWPAKWDEIATVAQMADAAGIEFFLPIARWKGYGGETNARFRNFETLTHGAALAAITKNITIFSTVHVPIVPPVFAAKALATIDHISNGRAGLNIVCGWNQPEFDMFGIEKAENVYDQGNEWYDILMEIYESNEPFDFKGKFYDLTGVEGAPKPVQKPRPVVLSAAFSPTGRDFAVRTSDFLFTTFTSLEKGRETIADVAERSEKAGRKIGVYTTCHIICRETRQEAEDYYAHYAVEMADNAAVDKQMDMQKKMAFSHDPEAFALHRKRFAGGAGTYPLVGTPEDIAAEMIAMSQAGFAGTTLTFVNFKNEMPYFLENILPLLQKAGLRS
jgi:alkanesulfonate monooxygenase SsuD/methylene tetrahydromethanopterin reductase-like flavin-dependent oxidoreductase (luciferase family)